MKSLICQKIIIKLVINWLIITLYLILSKKMRVVIFKLVINWSIRL